MNYLKGLRNQLLAEITTVPAIVQDSYYTSLDGLRGIAILVVILAHFGVNRILRPLHISIDGDIGVNIFFVISGFLITTLLLKEKLKHGNISLKRFYIRRVLRILPVAYLFLIVLIILNILFKLEIQWLDFLASFAFLKNLPIKNEPYTAHFWSLAVEVQFYLIFPFLLALNVNRYTVIALLIVVGVSLISVLGFYQPSLLNVSSTVNVFTKVIMYSFWKGPVIILIGSLSSVFLFKGIIKAERIRSGYFLSSIVLFAAIVISTRSFEFYSKYVSEILSAIMIAYVILLSLNKENFLSGVLKNPILVKAGIISYSLYLWQQLFIGVNAWQPWMKFFYGYPIGVLVIIKLIMVLLISFISYYFFESKFLKIKTRYL